MYLHPKSLYKRILYILASSIIYRSSVSSVKLHGRLRKLPLRLRELPVTVCFKLDKPLVPLNNYTTLLFIDLNRDAIMYLDGKPYHGYDRYHKRIVLDDLSREHSVCLDISSTGTMGERLEPPILKSITYLVVDKNMWTLGNRLKYILEIAEAIEDNGVRRELLELIRSILDKVYVGSVDVNTLEAFLDIVEPTMGTFRELVDELRVLTHTSKAELRIAGFRKQPIEASIADVIKELDYRLEELSRKYWKDGCLYAIAHSHIDLVWLWSFRETIDKIARTFLNTLWLLEHYSHVHYIQSSALFYELIKKHYPEIYSRIREYVEKGRWEIVGGMWVESDTILPGLESLIRQFFYGQRFFQEEFGLKPRIVWLPDSFGFNPVLPQIMKSAGLDTFITHKLLWNAYNKFPYNLFRWRGIDGSEVLSIIVHGGYGVDIKPYPILKMWRDYCAKEVYPKTLLIYGFGDGGGGATIDHVEKLLVYSKSPLMPSIECGCLRDYVNDIWESVGWSKLPVWSGELYLELHRGTYTTNLLVKKLVYSVEKKLRYLETLSSIAYLYGRRYPLKEIDKLWKKLLKHEFHDTLPGTCTYTVYKEVYRELNEIGSKVDKMIKDIARYIVSKIGFNGVIVFNPISFSRKTYIELDLPKDSVLVDRDDSIIPIQRSSSKAVVELDLKPLTFHCYRIASVKDRELEYRDKVYAREYGDRIVVENKYYRIVFRNNGLIESIYDKEADRELLAKPSNLLIAYDDRPYEWSAWDIDEDYQRLKWIVNHECKPVVKENGPLRVRISFKWRFRKSTIVEDVVVYASKRNIDFYIRMDWNERNILLKVWFYPDINTDQAYYDVGGGYIVRPSHRNTSWERAKYEVYKHKWVAVKDDFYVFTVFSHERNGVSVYFNEIGLSLLKTPIYPNPLSDYGELSTYYSIAGLPGCIDERVYRIAYDLSHEPIIVYSNLPGGIGVKEFLKIDREGVVIEDIKKCHVGKCIVFRMYNPLNRPVCILMKFDRYLDKCMEVNILEEDLREFDCSNRELRVCFRPFEIKSIKLYFKQNHIGK